MSFKQIKILTALFVSTVVGMAVSMDNIILAVSGVVVAMILLKVLTKKMGVKTSDEMIENVTGRAAKITYALITPAMAITAIILMFWGKDTAYLMGLGTIFAYLSLTMIGVYSLVYKMLMKKYK